MSDSPYLTVRQAAAYLGYASPTAEDSMRQMIHRKRVPIYRRGGRTILVKREDLDELMETGSCDRGQKRRARELAVED
jgi:excisionase family DNA binding protein